jgi:hypothetical protein
MNRAVPVFAAHVTPQGKLVVHDKDTMRAYVNCLVGEQVDLTIRKHVGKRSLNANAYWHGAVVDVLAEHLGYDHDEMHYALLGEWRGYEEGPFGQPIPRAVSSRNLGRDEFSELTEFGIRFAASLGVAIQSSEDWMAA